MTKEQLAYKLHGGKYGNEISKELIAEAKDNGLVVIFGASDDLMEFEGMICEEVDCYEGGTAYLNKDGLCKKKDATAKIKAIWAPEEPDCSWIYKTDLPHATFDIFEDGELYCKGLVFSITDLK